MSAMEYIQKKLFFGLSFFENSEAFALLLLLHVTKQWHNLAAVVSMGDVGVCDLCPSVGAMSSAPGAILIHVSIWVTFAADMPLVSWFPKTGCDI